MNVLVLGAGAQGAPCAAILARQPGVRRVLLGARNVAGAARVAERVASPKLAVAPMDASRPGSVASAVRRTVDAVDAVIDLTPSFRSRDVMRAALELRADYVNTAAAPEHLAELVERRPLALAAEFAEIGRTALLGCGASPGVLNVLCRMVCDGLDSVERVEIRVGFPSPAQHAAVRTWTPTWSPEQQYYDHCDPPCVFRDGRHEHAPVFHEPETYDFGGALGRLELVHHAHDETYSLPLSIGKGIEYCCFKYPFEPAIATLHATGFTPERVVRVNGAEVRALDVLMQLVPRPAEIALLDPAVQREIVPLLAATRAHVRIRGESAGVARDVRIETSAFLDQAGRALELFGTANVAVPYAAVTGALLLAERRTRPGIVWPEEFDPARFLEVAGGMGLELRYSVS